MQLLKPPLIEKVLEKESNLDNRQGYKCLYECYYCQAKFKTLNLLINHHKRNHDSWNKQKQVRYQRVVINGKYIKSRKDICCTKKVKFGHKHDKLEKELNSNLCNHQKEHLNSCYLRNCPHCESVRKWRYRKKYGNALLSFKRVSVLTLTFRGHHMLSKDKKKVFENHCRNFMKRLGRRLVYKIQYVRVMEVVKYPDGYYYHYHFLIDMPYVKQNELSNTWEETTGSGVVWIETLKDKTGRPIGQFWNRLSVEQKMCQAVNYITKYLAKPLSNIADQEYALYVYGSHFVETKLEEPFTCIKGQNSAMKCEVCGEKLVYISEQFEKKQLNDYKPPPDDIIRSKIMVFNRDNTIQKLPNIISR